MLHTLGKDKRIGSNENFCHSQVIPAVIEDLFSNGDEPS
jgi:hypothetical protein